jgi:hypothetical protein
MNLIKCISPFIVALALVNSQELNAISTPVQQPRMLQLPPNYVRPTFQGRGNTAGCSTQKQVVSQCALSNITNFDMTACLSCYAVSINSMPSYPTDCTSFSNELCLFTQTNCTTLCPWACKDAMNNLSTCWAAHPSGCAATCPLLSTTDGSSKPAAKQSASERVIFSFFAIIAAGLAMII